MPSNRTCKYVIQGITESGSKFRPSDWIDRIASLDAEYGDMHRLVYSDYVHPEVFEGERSLVIDMVLKQTNPELLDYILGFVKMNQLRMVKVCVIDGDYVRAPDADREALV